VLLDESGETQARDTAARLAAVPIAAGQQRLLSGPAGDDEARCLLVTRTLADPMAGEAAVRLVESFGEAEFVQDFED